MPPTDSLDSLGVQRLPIPVPFPEAGGPANVYVIEEAGGGLALFDSGIGTPEGMAALKDGFEGIGRSLAEIRRIFVSHGHLDHYGCARAAQEASGAPVFCHVRDHDKVTWRDRSPERRGWHADYLRTLGASAEVVALSESFSKKIGQMSRPLEQVEPLPAGARLRFARFEAEVLHLPGHTPGLVCLWAERDGVLFSDDHLLERVSPNPLIDLEEGKAPRHRALVEYLRSAVRARALEVKLVAPGHGPTFEGHVEIIDRLMAFYDRRQQKMLALLAEHGPRTPAALAPLVFPRAKANQQYLILSEVMGNLEVMEDHGRVRRLEQAGQIAFAAA